MSETVPLFQIDWGRNEVQNVVDSVTRGGYWAKGPYVDKFESFLADYHGVEHAVTFNSGTTALVGALEGIGVEEGDEVIVPSFTFIATANAVRLAGGTPVFAEIEPERYGLDPTAVEEAITERTTAILPVHYGGVPCRIHELREIADEHGLELVEDAAEAQGAKDEGEVVGSIGDAGVLSFCQNKIITTGEGGAVLTDDDAIAQTCELLRSHGRSSGDYFDSAEGGEYVRVGNNFRMSDINAALGVGQMERISDIIEKRRTVGARLVKSLTEIDGVNPPVEPSGTRHVYQLFTVRFDDHIDRDKVIDSLTKSDVSCKVYFDPVHLSKVYRDAGWRHGDLPRTEAISSQVLSLSMFAEQTPEQSRQIVDAVREAVGAQQANQRI